MASQLAEQVHFVLFPLMAPGHMIPMVDIGKLLAQCGIKITILTTAHNSKRFSKTIARATESGLQIQLLELHFPCTEAGLPDGCENLDMLPSLDMAGKFFVAISMIRQEVEQIIEKLTPKPNCLISDMGFPWTAQIAQKFHIPRIVFHGTCCFSLLCSHNIFASKILDTLNSDTEYFVVPGLPDRVEVTKAQVSGSMPNKNSNSAAMKDFRDQIREAERTSYGVVVNSFEELEPEYVKEYRKVKGEKVWCIGPVSLCNRDKLDMVERGKQNSIDEKSCLNWLDSQKPRCVVYASLGSLSRLDPSQLMELAFGLEESNRPFLWAFGGGGEKSTQLEKLISDNGFEERIKDRGLLIRGWAPQVLILSHQAVGGFLSHCGWNSTIEGISAGIPMVTWPQFAEQFCNEKLITEILKIGVSLGVSVPVKWGEEDKIGVLVKSEDVKKAVERLMDEGKEGEERRRRAKDLGEKANKAVDEGGSSYHSLTLLIQDVMRYSS